MAHLRTEILDRIKADSKIQCKMAIAADQHPRTIERKIYSNSEDLTDNSILSTLCDEFNCLPGDLIELPEVKNHSL